MKTRRIAAVAAGVLALSACQNPFPKVDPSKEALKPTKRERCQHVVAFSQQPGATDGNQTEMRLVGPANPSGTSLVLWHEEEAHIATNRTCKVNALGTNTGLQVVMAGGGVTTLAPGRVESVAVSRGGKHIFYVMSDDPTHVRKRTLASPSSEDAWFTLEVPEPQYRTEAGTNRPLVAVSFWRMNDGVMPNGALHLVRHDVEVYMDNWERLSERVNHFSLKPSKNGLKKGPQPIKAAEGCNRWNPSPTGSYGICINYVSKSDVFVSATAEIRDANNGKVVMSLPADLARYAVEPSLTKVDADILRRPDLYWIDPASAGTVIEESSDPAISVEDLDDDQAIDAEGQQSQAQFGASKKSDDLKLAIVYVVNGRNTDAAKTPKPGAGIFTYNLATGQRTQITDYPVSFWTMAP